MKIAGLVGGIAPESTIDYYRSIVRRCRARVDGGFPRVVINCIDLRRMLDLVAAGNLAALADYLAAEIDRLDRAGAEFGALASNTPHVVFEALERGSPIPLVSIVRVALLAARERGWKRVGLFGTGFTMRGGFYRDAFEAAGMTLILPSPAEQEVVHGKYMDELVNGIFQPETRERLIGIVSAMRERDEIEGLILGGTELPLLFRSDAEGGVPFLDTTALHVEEIVSRMFA